MALFRYKGLKKISHLLYNILEERGEYMEWIEIFKAIILGVIEGITEWLPVSSTGHMILVDEFIKLNMSKEFKEAIDKYKDIISDQKHKNNMLEYNLNKLSHENKNK